MGWIKNLINKVKDKKIQKQIAQKTQIGQVNQTKFDQGLKKSSNVFQAAIDDMVQGNTQIDQQLLEKIEELLISMDIGSGATSKILSAIEQEIKFQNVADPTLIKQIIIDKMFVYYIQDSMLDNTLAITRNKLNVILFSGANGVGKTTTIAKITKYLLDDHWKVCLIAGDTFRAGAVEQLEVWAQRLNVTIFKPKKIGQDPASVIYKGLDWANKNGIEVVLCDTSGRLQNKINLMNELKKIDLVIKKFNPDQPTESLLVLDATTGQSGLIQAQAFLDVTKLTGIILTKMDGTSKGGIILAIKDKFNLPVKFIGLGETFLDLQPFDLENYIYGLTKNFA